VQRFRAEQIAYRFCNPAGGSSPTFVFPFNNLALKIGVQWLTLEEGAYEVMDYVVEELIQNQKATVPQGVTAELELNVSSLRAEATKLKEEIQPLVEGKGVVSTVSALEHQVTNLESKLKEDMQPLVGVVGKLEFSVESLNDTLRGQEKTISELTKKLSDLTQKFSELENCTKRRWGHVLHLSNTTACSNGGYITWLTPPKHNSGIWTVSGD